MLAHSELRRELTSILISIAIVTLLMLLVVVPAHSQLPTSPAKAPEIIDQSAPVAIIVILIAQFVIMVSLMTIYLSREAGLKTPRPGRHPRWWQHIHVHH
jgi:hypothetical protein